MNDDGSSRFTCEQCGRRYKWKPELAGRMARCSCGATMSYPTTSPDADDMYDLAPQPQAIPSPAISAIQPVAPISKPTLAYRAPKEDAKSQTDTDKIRNLQMPMWLLAGGVLIEVIANLFYNRGQLDRALIEVGIQLILGTAVMLAGILIAAKLRQIDLGSFWIAVFKLSAISVAPAALVSLATPLLIVIPFGFLLGFIAQFILYFALLGALFDMDESDTWYCVWVIFLVRVVFYFCMMALLWKLH
jgi:hypothetical protein